MRLEVPRSPDLDGVIINYREGLKDSWLATVKTVIPDLHKVDEWHQPISTHLQRVAIEVAERVAFKFIYKVMKQVPSHAPDIMQEAHYIAILCAEKYVEHAEHDPHTFEKIVARSTKFQLINYAVALQPVHMPVRSFKRGIAKILGFEDGIIKMTTLDGVDKASTNKQYTEEEAAEVMQRLFCDLSEEDRKIATMRHMGYNLNEIAAEVGKSKSYIHKQLKAIRSSIL